MMRMGSKLEELIGVKITVSDLARSLDFYTRLVGLKPTSPADAAAALQSRADFVEVAVNHSGSRRDAALVLMRRSGVAPNAQMAQMTWTMFKVTDVSAAISRLKAEGYDILSEATPYEGLTFGLARDPDGYVVEFLQAESAG